ncbi:MAG: cytochrome c [Actinomycetota bacterium]|nr:cytochrome c [Actinomycetota bacterium]
MSRSFRVLLKSSASIAVAALVAACGSEHINVPAGTPTHAGAVLFNQRCAGCHTFSYAGTHGSAPNIRTAQANSGPNFNQRCERPVSRVLYAIENGGFSGAYMPQNVVVGQDAIDVAKFVATYAGRQAPHQLGIKPCEHVPVGSLPPGSGTAQVVSASSSATTPKSSTTKRPAKSQTTKRHQGSKAALAHRRAQARAKKKKKNAHA